MNQTLKIYRIDTKHRLLVDSNNSEAIIKTIVETSYKHNNLKRKFDVKSLNLFSLNEITYYLHVFSSYETVSDWKEFLPTNLTKDEDFSQQKFSLLLFIETDIDFYCVVGGNAYRIIVPFIDHSFGLNTYARIMQPASDELASIKSRGITGSRAGINEQFRDNYKIIDFVRFGKIPQEIHLKLSEETSKTHFRFLQKNVNERIQIFVGKAFKIKMGIDFQNLHKIIEELCIISGIEPSEDLSSYIEISNKQFIEDELKPTLINKIFDDRHNIEKNITDPNKIFEHDFCNPNNIEIFYEADEYRLKKRIDKNQYIVFKTVNDRNEIYRSVLSHAMQLYGTDDKFKFKVFLQGVRVVCYQNNKRTIGSSFLYHITTEIPYKNKPYFLIDTKWYSLRDSFVKDLKTNSVHVLKAYKAPENILINPWDKLTIRTEKAYNESYLNIPNYIVIDTIINDGVELCDLLYYDDFNLYLIHVKYGFTAKVRELTNQITISARRLREILSSQDSTFLEELYKKISDKRGTVDGLSFDDFKKLFEKKIIYVLAFTSHLKEDLIVEDNIEKFDSNIARFSLVQCSSEMRANYFDMLNYQIKRK
ncbi:TIGR04141 family sporadically distributed protein [Prolixibacteraceae bacterium Z1-6]|uniref:TIGR04141 family sporadically distributed protein n=1 Tax=Draconibacterium aestuarii TaxID=2998507 RepID=A0A9X3F3I2_9BACT|nr:TIGR04141 family sporadically distributed protein [Prolixibacteraceae bacterium Z1-6]